MPDFDGSIPREDSEEFLDIYCRVKISVSFGNDPSVILFLLRQGYSLVSDTSVLKVPD